jgi:hypothetical protein
MGNFKSTYKQPTSIEEVKAYVQQRNETLRSYIQRWSIIKNSTVEVSDERAIDAFTLRLRQGDLVEEMGRIKPKTISDLMDIANRFTDGKDACNNQKTIGEIDTVAKGEDPATTATLVLTVK